MLTHILRSASSSALALALLAPIASAHGGMYRGPSTGVPPIGGPTTGGGGIGGPSTGMSSAPAASPTNWQFWWEFNKASYLNLRASVQAVGAAAGLTETTQGPAASTLAPTDAQKREQILPALKRLLESTDNKDIATACMVAMAKIGFDHPDFEILPIFRRRLSRGNQEIRETAALCLGISRRPDALGDLLPLALDEARGRKLVGRATVSDRTRAFAIYGLGLIARHNDTGIKRQVAKVLRELLSDRDTIDRDVRVALIQSIGTIGPDIEVPGQKRVLWQCLESLWNDYRRELGKGDEITQAHVPTSIARLLGRGTTLDHERYKQRLVDELVGRRRRSNAIYQSAALALGRLALPQEQHPPDRAVHDALVRYAQRGKDELARNFCLIALGEIGGEKNRTELIDFYRHGGKATVKPWAAIALGVLAFHERNDDPRKAVDQLIGRLLHKGLVEVENADHRAAVAVALGLCGYEPATDDLKRYLDKYKRYDMVGGYLCIGLALLEARSALPDIRQLIEKSVRRPLLLGFASVALGRLGDKSASQLLLGLIGQGDTNLAKLGGIATALGLIGDKRTITPLVELMFDTDMSTMSRAFVAAALGGIADPLPLPWNAPLASGTNYRADVTTLTNGSTGVLDIY